MSFVERFLMVVENKRLQLTLLVVGIFGGALGYFLSEKIEPRYPVSALIKIGTDFDGKLIDEVPLIIERLKTVEFLTAIAERLGNSNIVRRLDYHEGRMGASTIRGIPILRVVVSERSEEESKRTVEAVAQEIVSYYQKMSIFWESKVTEIDKYFSDQKNQNTGEPSDKDNNHLKSRLDFLESMSLIEINSERYKLISKIRFMTPTHIMGYVSEQHPWYPILRPIRFVLLVSIGAILVSILFFMYVSVGSSRSRQIRTGDIE